MSPAAAPERLSLAGVDALVWQGSGAGRTVALHGFSGHPLAWLDVVSHLGSGGMVLAPFLPGHGSPPQGPPPGGFADAVGLLARAVSGWHPGPWRLAGYSLGARLALGLLVAAPGLWSDALLIGVNPGLDDAGERRTRRAEDAVRAGLLRAQGVAAFVDTWERLPLLDSQRALSAELLARQRELRLTHEAAGLAWSLEALGLGSMPSFWSQLPRIAQRVVLVAGEKDRRFAELARRAATLLPRGRCEVVPGVGHNVVLEAPEVVARLLEEVPVREVAGTQEEA